MRSEPHRIEGSHSCVLQHRNIPELSKHGNYSPGLGGLPGTCTSCASQAPVDSQQFTHGQTCRHGLVGHKDSVLSSPASVEPQASQDAQVMSRTSLKQTCFRQSTTMACLSASPPASPPPPSSQLPAPSSQLPAPSSQSERGEGAESPEAPGNRGPKPTRRRPGNPYRRRTARTLHPRHPRHHP